MSNSFFFYRGDKDAFWAVRGKRSASSDPAEISLEDRMETTYQYLKLIQDMIQVSIRNYIMPWR